MIKYGAFLLVSFHVTTGNDHNYDACRTHFYILFVASTFDSTITMWPLSHRCLLGHQRREILVAL